MKSLTLAPAYTTALAAAMLAAPMIATPTRHAAAQFGIGLSITVAPPELPEYEQPPLPGPGYLWTPGYWAYGPLGYYWVPGTWVLPPEVGLLWTPPYWGWNNGVYVFNRGYWGPHVGFYGGINYGFGYGGEGYEGGEWRGREFAYNRAVNNFGRVHVTNVYERNVVVNDGRRLAFNGPNGVNIRPRPEEIAVMHERHVQPIGVQMQHERLASQNRELLSSVNHGRPAIAATERPASFRGPGVVPARGEIGRGEMARPGQPAAPHWGNYGNAARPTPQSPQPGASTATRPGFGVAHPGSTMAPHPGGGPRPQPMSQPVPHPGMTPRPIHAPAEMAPRPMAAPRNMAPEAMQPRSMEPRGMGAAPMAPRPMPPGQGMAPRGMGAPPPHAAPAQRPERPDRPNRG